MRHMSFKKCEPWGGVNVPAFCAGLAHRPYDTQGDASKIGSYGYGARVGRNLPRRLARRRAARILREYRVSAEGLRGHMVSAMAVPDPTPGFTRYPESAAVVRARIDAEAERISIEANRQPYAAAMKAAEGGES